jgi:hypothetical protein
VIESKDTNGDSNGKVIIEKIENRNGKKVKVIVKEVK